MKCSVCGGENSLSKAFSGRVIGGSISSRDMEKPTVCRCAVLKAMQDEVKSDPVLGPALKTEKEVSLEKE